MTTAPSTTHSPARAPAAEAAEAVAMLDRSARWPVLFLYVKAIGWLLLGSILLVIAAIKGHSGSFLAEPAWLTLGRIRPAAMNAIIYGFAFQAGLGTLLWMFVRLGRNPLLNAPIMMVGGVLWNLGVLAGVIGILAGYSTGFRWLEMPGFVAFFLFASYALIGIWAAITFHSRATREVYVSHWYLLAALFFFPWLYSAATYLLIAQPVRGVMQAAVNAWFVNGLFWLVLAPIGLAILYYFLPRILGRPLQNRALAAFGFWCYVFVAPWMGMTQFVGGPFPAWLISTGIAGALLFLLPLVAIAQNWAATVASQRPPAPPNLLAKFVGVSALAFLVGALLYVLTSARSVSRITQFSLVPVAIESLLLFGFVGMALFAALYYVVPRITATAWPSMKLVRIHFWATVVGVGLILVGYGIGGLIQGSRMQDPGVDLLSITKGIVPFIGLATLGATSFLVGQCALALNMFQLCRRFCAEACSACCGWLGRSEVAP